MRTTTNPKTYRCYDVVGESHRLPVQLILCKCLHGDRTYEAVVACYWAEHAAIFASYRELLADLAVESLDLRLSDRQWTVAEIDRLCDGIAQGLVAEPQRDRAEQLAELLALATGTSLDP